MKENEIFCSFSTFWEKQKWKMNSWFVTSSKTWKTSRFCADLNKRWKLFWRMGSKINHEKRKKISYHCDSDTLALLSKVRHTRLPFFLMLYFDHQTVNNYLGQRQSYTRWITGLWCSTRKNIVMKLAFFKTNFKAFFWNFRKCPASYYFGKLLKKWPVNGK